MGIKTFIVPTKYIVFKSTNTGEYHYALMQKDHIFLQVDETFIPILYTDSKEIALQAVIRLEGRK